MEKTITGKAYVLGDKIDTDQIIPAEHLVYSLSDPEEKKMYGKFAMSGVPVNEAGLPTGGVPFISGDKVESDYQIIVAGGNYGCGSSREHAPFAMAVAGVKAVIAESYARIFYRNCVDGGFLIPYESFEKVNDKIKTGDQLELDVQSNLVKNLTTGETILLKPLGDVAAIIEAGDLFSYARLHGMMAG